MPVSGSENISEEAIGKLPQSMIEEELSELLLWHENNTDIVSSFLLLSRIKIFKTLIE